ncbi:trafficking protein particle complex subunit 11 [Iris pallida]|uniref:Trafficking protein particle complex subunit 11 n=1 Tax=Iris pallida TaxID=29817 RepID=A0AAX6E780_IRIPA|nr:trafficking protein particle complex subunit 11 [Iris pallida]
MLFLDSVAVYAEFRRDWTEALRFYGDAYNAMREMVGTSTRLPPIQRLVEIKAMAEQLHFKVSTLLLHGGKIVEAINWFHKHVANYQRVVGAPEVAFLHWEWFSRQFLVFAELLETSSAAVPSNLSPNFGTSDNPLTEWEFQPAYYYELSAHYLREKRNYLDFSLSTLDTIGGNPESVIPSTYVGQFGRLFEQGDTVTMLPLSDVEYTSYALVEGQRFQDSIEIIALFRRASESFNNLKAPRTASYCSSRMAWEYFAAEDFSNAKQLLEGVTALYRQEGWVTLLWESLGYLRECSRRLGSTEDFVQYSLEMAALPILSSNESETVERKKEHGPGGPASLSQRKKIQEEVLNLIKGDHASDGISSLNNVSKDHPLHLEIDLISPLRVALLASVAFHDLSVKPGSSTFITLSLLSQLPLPVEMDQLQCQFNQPNCSFKVVTAREKLSTLGPLEDQDIRVECAPSLVLTANKWLRMTFEIKPAQSGRLECLSVTVVIGDHFKICCRAESAASMEDLPLWKFEDRVETFPTKDPSLAFTGQKFIQVEEPEPQVDLTLSASGPVLVGENFIIPVSVVSKGHAVHSGELKINLVDARGDGLLISPRDAESFSSIEHYVELLSISGKFEEDESHINSDCIKKIQQSFGVVSVPDLAPDESWSCTLEIKWHRPKSVMLYVSLGYHQNSTGASFQRLNVHKSLQIEGQTPLVISHHFMMPFRREPLLLSKEKQLPGSDQKVSLPLNEKSILIVSARNCTEVPLRLLSMSIDSESDDDVRCSCSVSGGTPSEPALFVPGEEFKKVFSVTPQVDSRSIGVGTVCLEWTRELDSSQQSNSVVLTKHKLSSVSVEKPPLVVSLECPPHVVLGVPFSFYVRVRNLTNLLQEIKYSLGDSQSFVFSGAHNDAVSILPKTEHIINYKLVPFISGPQQLPRLTITSVRYASALNPSVAATTVFVFPSEPQFKMEEERRKGWKTVLLSEIQG